MNEFISSHFEDLSLAFLQQNCLDFHDNNVMNHPQSVVQMVNRRNQRSKDEVVYICFTTVVYVLIACIFRLNVKIDDADILRKFLQGRREERKSKTEHA